MSHWNVFSNHGHVLLFLSQHPDARLRDVAAAVGITERAVQKIVRDMQDSGVVSVTKRGRRNRYAIDGASPLRHDLEAHCCVGEVVGLIANGTEVEGLQDESLPASAKPETKPVEKREATKTDAEPRKSRPDRARGADRTVNETRDKAGDDASKEASTSTDAAGDASRKSGEQGSLF